MKIILRLNSTLILIAVGLAALGWINLIQSGRPVRAEEIILPWGTADGEFGVILNQQTGRPAAELPWSTPASFCFDFLNNLYILDNLNYRVQIFDSQGRFNSSFKLPVRNDDSEQINVYSQISVDFGGTIYLTNITRNSLREYSLGGVFEREIDLITDRPDSLGQLGRAFTVRDSIVVQDLVKNCAYLINSSGEILKIYTDVTMAMPLGRSHLIFLNARPGENAQLFKMELNSTSSELLYTEPLARNETIDLIGVTPLDEIILILSATGRQSFEVVKLKNGEILATDTVPLPYFEVSVGLDSDGELYYMTSESQGLILTRVKH